MTWNAVTMHAERVAAGLPIDLTPFRDWVLDTRLATDIGEVSLVAGGSQNVVLRVVLDSTSYVLRHPPVHPRPHSNRAMVREMRVLRALAGSGVPHPRFVAGQDDLSSGEPVFYVMEDVEGFNPQVELEPAYADRADWPGRAGLDAVHALAHLGGLDPVRLGLADLGVAATFRERQIARAAEAWGVSELHPGHDGTWIPDLAEAVDWLRSTMPPAQPAGLVHGDFHLGNLLMRRDVPEVAAVLDWEMCTVGDPLLDIGYLSLCWPDPDVPAVIPTGTFLAGLPGFPSRAETVAAYVAASSREVLDLDWYVALAALKMGVLTQQNHLRALDGKMDARLGEYSHQLARGFLGTLRDIASGTWAGSVR